ncbi:MAG: hypothetical protein ACR2PW_04755 [Gammaproteobacteria bacterium]
MPYKHQTESYRDGGKWTCWCDAYDTEHAAHVVSCIKAQGFKAKRSKERVFVETTALDQINADQDGFREPENGAK